MILWGESPYLGETYLLSLLCLLFLNFSFFLCMKGVWNDNSCYSFFEDEIKICHIQCPDFDSCPVHFHSFEIYPRNLSYSFFLICVINANPSFFHIYRRKQSYLSSYTNVALSSLKQKYELPVLSVSVFYKNA